MQPEGSTHGGVAVAVVRRVVRAAARMNIFEMLDLVKFVSDIPHTENV